MAYLTVRNLTNSPHDLEGGIRLPALGSISGEFSDHYAALLRVSSSVEIVAATPPKAEAPIAMGDSEPATEARAQTGKSHNPNSRRGKRNG